MKWLLWFLGCQPQPRLHIMPTTPTIVEIGQPFTLDIELTDLSRRDDGAQLRVSGDVQDGRTLRVQAGQDVVRLTMTPTAPTHPGTLLVELVEDRVVAAATWRFAVTHDDDVQLDRQNGQLIIRLRSTLPEGLVDVVADGRPLGRFETIDPIWVVGTTRHLTFYPTDWDGRRIGDPIEYEVPHDHP